MRQPPQQNWAIPWSVCNSMLDTLWVPAELPNSLIWPKEAICSSGNTPPEDAASVVGYMVIGGPGLQAGPWRGASTLPPQIQTLRKGPPRPRPPAQIQLGRVVRSFARFSSSSHIFLWLPWNSNPRSVLTREYCPWPFKSSLRLVHHHQWCLWETYCESPSLPQ